MDSFTISLESFRSFRGPLFRKPVADQELFFAVSYSKPALGRQETGELEEVQRCLPKPTAGDKSDSFHKNTPCPLSCCSHSKGTKVLGYVCFVTTMYL